LSRSSVLADEIWQLFIIEGIFTICVGVALIVLFPRNPANPVSLCRFSIFDERERHILVQRVLMDDPSKRQPRPNIPWTDVKKAVRRNIVSHIDAAALARSAYTAVVPLSFVYVYPSRR
jgi:hypothetical protein